jgi:GTP pyrophosphokinase
MEVASLQELEKEFGDDVAGIVDGSTRITNVHYTSELAHQAENIRKLLIALGADIRVLLVKLADRIQDMVTLSGVEEERRRQVSRETIDLYAPLASRLGIDWMKRELEDFAFQYLFPKEYSDLTKRLESTLDERQEYVEEVIKILRDRLAKDNVYPVRIIGRPKHLYSIYKKLVAQRISLEKVFDKVAFRILVNTVQECYQALGVVHGEWTPVPERIKDFISTPKKNNYQSLHTTVVGPNGQFIEIQIRTEKMDRVAQEGVAAHWAYKEGQKISEADARVFQDMKQLVQQLHTVEDPGEFLDSVRGELYEAEIFALTPGGEVRELPRGSTPIDFAYSIHTAVGDSCSGAKVNGQLVPLRHEIQNGDVVEILTTKNQHPRRAWLQIVKTSRAKTRIRQWLRREEREKSLARGRDLCERELKKHDVSLKRLVKSGHIKELLKRLRCNSLDDMLAKVGSGVISIKQLVRTLQPDEVREEEGARQLETELLEKSTRAIQQSTFKDTGRDAFEIDGVDGMLVRVGHCCKPVPGDAIIGFITTGRGVTIHKKSCTNLRDTDPRRWLEVSWSGKDAALHQTELFLRTENRRGLVAEISSVISADDADIIRINKRITSADLLELSWYSR